MLESIKEDCGSLGMKTTQVSRTALDRNSCRTAVHRLLMYCQSINYNYDDEKERTVKMCGEESFTPEMCGSLFLLGYAKLRPPMFTVRSLYKDTFLITQRGFESDC